MLIQTINGNTSMGHLQGLAEFLFTEAAFCKARKRLPVDLLYHILELIASVAHKHVATVPDNHCFADHEIFLIDGTSASMPDTDELREAFGDAPSQKDGLGFPVASYLMKMNYQTGMCTAPTIDSWRANNMTHALGQYAQLPENSLHVGDRAFGNHTSMFHIIKQNR